MMASTTYYAGTLATRRPASSCESSPIYQWESGLWIPWSHWIGLS